MSSPRPLLNVVLVEPEIPPNTGNVGRLCLSVGARLHLVGPLGFSLDEKQLRRAGLDYWQNVDLQQWSNFEELRGSCAAGEKFWFFTTKTERSYWDVEFCEGDYLVFGRETKGLPQGLLEENLGQCVGIPMGEGGRSLNLATSVGIGVYEALRQFS
jgi:tRNA (cytidine/uridine-2'-O-)-methyltransferase